MGVKAINNPLYVYTCDLCGKEDRGQNIPANWDVISLSSYQGGTGQFYICQECQTDCSIAHLINKARTTSSAIAAVTG